MSTTSHGSRVADEPGDRRDPFVTLQGRFGHWPPGLLVLLTVGAAGFVRWGLDQVWNDEFPFIAFYPAVAVCAVVAGWRWGLLAGVVSTLLALLLSEVARDARFVTDLGLFLLAELVIVFFIESGRRARMRAESAAMAAWERERRFTDIANSLPLLIWVHDADGRVLFGNRAWREFAGSQSLAATSADFWQDRVHPEDRVAYSDRFLACMHRHQPFLGKARVRRADGEWRVLQSYGVPRLGAQGELLAYAGTSFDVTERETLEAEREVLLESERAARTEAELATRAKDEFLANLSHELRTPLSVIVLWSRILARKHESAGEDLRKGLALIIDNGMALSQLISDLLDMSRIVSGRVTLELRPVDVAELVEQAVASHRPAAEARHVALSLEIGPKPKIVLADPTRLQQVLWNLLSNALKFTNENGHVWVSALRHGDRLDIAVRDDGAGIAPDFLPQVFSRFRQADSSSARRHGGLGLGLAIVKQFVEMQDGGVTASSAGPGQGATFTVSLPLHESVLARIDTDATGTWRRLDPDRQLELRLDGLRVLAVEDQQDMLESLCGALEEYGAAVTAATSGAAACTLLRERGGDFDALVSDLGMPGMDGYELIRCVRHDLGIGPDRLVAVALTAFSRDEDRRHALQVGYQAHVSKPYQFGQLVAALKQALDTRPVAAVALAPRGARSA